MPSAPTELVRQVFSALAGDHARLPEGKLRLFLELCGASHGDEEWAELYRSLRARYSFAGQEGIDAAAFQRLCYSERCVAAEPDELRQILMHLQYRPELLSQLFVSLTCTNRQQRHGRAPQDRLAAPQLRSFAEFCGISAGGTQWARDFQRLCSRHGWDADQGLDATQFSRWVGHDASSGVRCSNEALQLFLTRQGCRAEQIRQLFMELRNDSNRVTSEPLRALAEAFELENTAEEDWKRDFAVLSRDYGWKREHGASLLNLTRTVNCKEGHAHAKLEDLLRALQSPAPEVLQKLGTRQQMMLKTLEHLQALKHDRWSRLDEQSLSLFAEVNGFKGDESAWADEFKALGAKFGFDTAHGASGAQFADMLHDEGCCLHAEGPELREMWGLRTRQDVVEELFHALDGDGSRQLSDDEFLPLLPLCNFTDCESVEELRRERGWPEGLTRSRFDELLSEVETDDLVASLKELYAASPARSRRRRRGTFPEAPRGRGGGGGPGGRGDAAPGESDEEHMQRGSSEDDEGGGRTKGVWRAGQAAALQSRDGQARRPLWRRLAPPDDGSPTGPEANTAVAAHQPPPVTHVAVPAQRAERPKSAPPTRPPQQSVRAAAPQPTAETTAPSPPVSSHRGSTGAIWDHLYGLAQERALKQKRLQDKAEQEEKDRVDEFRKKFIVQGCRSDVDKRVQDRLHYAEVESRRRRQESLSESYSKLQNQANAFKPELSAGTRRKMRGVSGTRKVEDRLFDLHEKRQKELLDRQTKEAEEERKSLEDRNAHLKNRAADGISAAERLHSQWERHQEKLEKLRKEMQKEEEKELAKVHRGGKPVDVEKLAGRMYYAEIDRRQRETEKRRRQEEMEAARAGVTEEEADLAMSRTVLLYADAFRRAEVLEHKRHQESSAELQQCMLVHAAASQRQAWSEVDAQQLGDRLHKNGRRRRRSMDVGHQQQREWAGDVDCDGVCSEPELPSMMRRRQLRRSSSVPSVPTRHLGFLQRQWQHPVSDLGEECEDFSTCSAGTAAARPTPGASPPATPDGKHCWGSAVTPASASEVASTRSLGPALHTPRSSPRQHCRGMATPSPLSEVHSAHSVGPATRTAPAAAATAAASTAAGRGGPAAPWSSAAPAASAPEAEAASAKASASSRVHKEAQRARNARVLVQTRLGQRGNDGAAVPQGQHTGATAQASATPRQATTTATAAGSTTPRRTGARTPVRSRATTPRAATPRGAAAPTSTRERSGQGPRRSVTPPPSTLSKGPLSSQGSIAALSTAAGSSNASEASARQQGPLLDGRWTHEGQPGERVEVIKGGVLMWEEGHQCKMKLLSKTKFSIRLDEETHWAELRDDRLIWEDGDVWIRLEAVLAVAATDMRAPSTPRFGQIQQPRQRLQQRRSRTPR